MTEYKDVTWLRLSVPIAVFLIANVVLTYCVAIICGGYPGQETNPNLGFMSALLNINSILWVILAILVVVGILDELEIYISAETHIKGSAILFMAGLVFAFLSWSPLMSVISIVCVLAAIADIVSIGMSMPPTSRGRY